MDLITLAELKSFIGITALDHDTLLSTCITKVSARVEEFLNRQLEKKARTQYFDAGRKNYFLPAYPIDLAAALTVVNYTTTQVLDTNYYVWEDAGKVEFYTAPIKVVPKQIKITWTGGYASSVTIPDPIKLGMLMQCSFLFRKKDTIGVQSVSMPDGSLAISGSFDLLNDVKKVMHTYRRSAG
jgi:hypothetical protein